MQQEMNGLRGNAADGTPTDASYSQSAMAVAKADTFDLGGVCQAALSKMTATLKRCPKAGF
jgi:hypothetical protein